MPHVSWFWNRHGCHWLKFTDQISFLAFQSWLCCFCLSLLVGLIRDQIKQINHQRKKRSNQKSYFIQEGKSRAVLGNSVQYVPYPKRTQLLWIVFLFFFCFFWICAQRCIFAIQYNLIFIIKNHDCFVFLTSKNTSSM